MLCPHTHENFANLATHQSDDWDLVVGQWTPGRLIRPSNRWREGEQKSPDRTAHTGDCVLMERTGIGEGRWATGAGLELLTFAPLPNLTFSP